jgi:hypothetical protein
MASSLYTHYKKLALSGHVNLVTDTIKVMLVSGTYNGSTFANSNTHIITGDIATVHEVVDTLGSYVRGGKVLTNGTVSADTTDSEGVYDADDVSWTSSTITASGAVIYKSGSDPTRMFLIAYVDFGGNQTSSNGTFSIVWNTEGIINWS